MKLVATVLLLSALALTTNASPRIKRQGFLDFTASNWCQTPRQENGVCLNIKQCPPMVDLLVTQRHNREVVKYLRSSVCGYEGLDPKVCCPSLTGKLKPLGDAVAANKSATEAPKPTTTTTTTTEVAPDRAGSGAGVLPPPGECGFALGGHSRVVGGVNASLGAWPWMAALGYHSTKGNPGPVFLCGGSLVTSKHVLTAAHCVHNKKNLYMTRVGDLNLYRDDDGATPMDVLITKRIVHDGYNPTTFINDISMLQLAEDVPFTNLIRPICLPVSREMRSRNFDNRRPFIAGWGTTSFNGPSSAVLLELMIPVVKETECQRAFASFKTAVIDSRVICAGYLRGGKDACRGDSGGPLMDYNNQEKVFYQIGVVSYGYKCAEPGFPGVYTRVTSFADWIEKVVTEP